MTVTSGRVSGWRTLWELWRAHKLGFVVAALAVLLAGLYLALVAVPNVYEAETVVTLRPVAGNPSSLVGRDFAMEVASSAILEAAAEKLGLIRADSAPMTRQAAGEELAREIRVADKASSAGDVEIRISSRGTARAEIARRVNLVAETWVALRQGRNRTAEAGVSALQVDVRRLTDSLAEITTSVDSAKSALKDFETRHAEAMADAGTDADAALRALAEDQKKNAADLERVQADIAGLEGAEKLLRGRLAEVPEFSEKKEVTTVRDPERVGLEREVRLLEKQLEEMLKTYTFKHPDVIALQTEILLKKRALRQRSERVEDSVKSSKEPNPEYAVLKGKLDDAVVKLQLARSSLTPLAGAKQSLAAKIEALRAFAEPHRKLAERMADVAKLQQENQALLKSKEDALAGARQALEAVPGIARAAEVPSSPVGPSRSLWAALVIILSILAGGAGMSAAFHAGRGVASEYELGRIAGVPVAGSIGAVAGTEAGRRQDARTRARLFVMLGLAALAAVAIVVMAQYSGR